MSGLAEKVKALVDLEAQRELKLLRRKLLKRETQRDEWVGKARCLRADLKVALLRVSQLEAEVKRLLPYEQLQVHTEQTAHLPYP